MSNIPTINQWKRGLQIAEQIAALESEMKALMGGTVGNAKQAALASGTATAGVVKKKGGMSAAGRARIAAAQRLRWSKIKKAKASAPTAKAADAKEPAPKTAVKKKRTVSPEVKAKLAKAMKARWAAAKAGKGPAPTARKK